MQKCNQRQKKQHAASSPPPKKIPKINRKKDIFKVIIRKTGEKCIFSPLYLIRLDVLQSRMNTLAQASHRGDPCSIPDQSIWVYDRHSVTSTFFWQCHWHIFLAVSLAHFSGSVTEQMQLTHVAFICHRCYIISVIDSVIK
jgi:hypothetical protein